jgi:hypothetical protein
MAYYDLVVASQAVPDVYRALELMGFARRPPRLLAGLDMLVWLARCEGRHT